ncbi:MAG TPA: divalent metal cation transporter [Pyrinomonadaceae bacterium]|jgi:Mn2+/Fe2+ NRAMP family transporter
MKKVFELALGIVTSVGGFLEIGSITTAAQAGALFGYQLVWAIMLGGLCVIFLVEQAGRLAASSRRTIPDAIRERFGFEYYAVLLVVMALVMLLVLGAELGGICIALEFVTGIGYRWWAVPVALVMWLIIWKGTFSFIEQGVSALGLVTVCFIVAAFILHPDWARVAAGALPTLPTHERARYWFIAVSILGASITPYLMFFYSSGAIEDKWDESYLGVNRIIATVGMSFGSVISIAVLVVAALVFLPRGIRMEHYQELARLLTDAFGVWGVRLVAASVGIACLGAALEITLEMAYMIAQGFGWNWSKNQRPIAEARFSLTYTIVVILGALVVVTGIDPLKLTVFSMALTAATLPLAIVPFLFLMNDEHYVGEHGNGWLSNTVVVVIIGLAFVLAVVTIPLEIFGGG